MHTALSRHAAHCDQSRRAVTCCDVSRIHPDMRNALCFPSCVQSVVAALDKLPATRHDLASFTADVFIIPPIKGSPAQRCMLTIKGRMQEKSVDSSWKERMFHRTFILIAPAPPDSLSAGWQVAICNDQIDIRNAPHPSTAAATAPQAQQASPGMQMQGALMQSPTPGFQQQQQQASPGAQGGLSAEQMQCCQQLAAQCPGVTLELAARCLAENGWQLPQAVPAMQQFLAMGGNAM